MVNYHNFYESLPYALEPTYTGMFSGYRVPISELGSTTSVQTVKQVQEVSSRLNEGVKNVEVSMVNKEVFDMIPEEDLKDINRMAKLTGAEMSFHVPIKGMEASGFSEQGGWSEENRQIIENQIVDMVSRGKKLNPDGNMPIVVHASSSLPGSTKIKRPGAKEGEIDSLVVYNRVEGRLSAVKGEEHFQPHLVPGKAGQPEVYSRTYTPEQELRSKNKSFWDNQLSQLGVAKEGADKLMEEIRPYLAPASTPEMKAQAKKVVEMKLQNADFNYENVQLSANSLYNQAMRIAKDTGNKKLLNALKETAGGYTQLVVKSQNSMDKGNEMDAMLHKSQALQFLIGNMHAITTEKAFEDPKTKKVISPYQGCTPKVNIPVDDFAVEQSSKTFSNVAFNAYKEFGTKAPIISIENPPYGGALSTAKDLKRLVKESRKKFANMLVKKENMNFKKAEKIAEKHLGVTWDTAHIAMIKNRGFSNKDLIKEAKTIAPYVKHMHMNDSLGGSGSDLPPGMGDTAVDKVLEEFNKVGFKGKKVFEGGAFAANWQTSPNALVFEAMGSPLDVNGGGGYWNEVRYGMGNYNTGFGLMLPDKHFSMYGGGFSQLPTELGGQISGGSSRFSGTPNA